jgi:hypothetical protein
MDDTHRPDRLASRASGRQRGMTYQRSGALAALAAVTALALAACGQPSSPNVASLGKSSDTGNRDVTTTTVAPSRSSGAGSPGESSLLEQLQFARCMRSNGVSNFPDPNPDKGELQNIANAGVDTQSPTFKAAFQACEKYTPAGNPTAQSAADNAKGVEFSQCMRAHGVPNFPDPITGPAGEQAINLGPEHIDPTSPIVQAADQACQKIVPGSK